MVTRRSQLVLLLLIPVVVLLGLLIRPAQSRAHGIGLPQVINVANGPYLVSVWTDPDPLREDETHFVIAVMNPDTRAPLVTDITVSVRLEDVRGGESLTATALADNSVNQLLYVVEFNDQVTAGEWQATILVDGPLGTAGDVTFPVDITPARGFNWMWLGVGGLGLAVVAWLALAGRSEEAKRPRHRASVKSAP